MTEFKTSYLQEPLITIGMPIYNAGDYLKDAILSIVRQTYKNWELIIIDDGSTDASLSKIADIQDQRIIIIKEEKNKGLASRLNQTVAIAKGTFFARMDQDDIALPDRLKIQLEAILNNPKIDVVSSRVLTINYNNEIIGSLPFVQTHEKICARPWQGFYMPHPTWFGKIEWFRKNPYASPAPYFCEDQELMLRAYKYSRFESVDNVLLHYRIRDTINLKKAFKTRLALLRCQLNIFNYRNIGFSALSLLIFTLRISKDFLHKTSEFFRY